MKFEDKELIDINDLIGMNVILPWTYLGTNDSTSPYKVTIIVNIVTGYCTSLREENLYTGEVKWFDVDDGVRYPNNDFDRLENEYKQINREEKLKQLDL